MFRCDRLIAPAWRRHLLRLGVLSLLSGSAGHVLADLGVDLSTSAADLVAGDMFELTVTVTNSGPGSVADVDARVFFLIDDGMNATFGEFVSSSPTGCSVVTPALQQGYVSCPIASLPASAQTSFTLTLQSSASSAFFLDPGGFLVDDGMFVTDGMNFVSDFLRFNVARNTTLDSDGDGVGNLAETLLGFDPNNPFLTPAAPTVDLLIYHTQGAADEYGGDPTTRINHLVAVANQISTDSGVGINYNVNAIRFIAASDTDSNLEALTKMLGGTGEFATVDAQRDTDNADVVLLMRPDQNDGNCGFASVLGVGREGDIDFGDANQDAFGTVSITCRTRTTAHELGHILGLGHDRRDTASNGTFGYSRGYGIDDDFVTVMGVASNYTNVFLLDEVNLFSSPVLDCGGAVPCGIARTDPVNGADAAFSLTGVGHLASTFRLLDSDGDLVPDDQDAFPAMAGEQFDTDGDGLGNNADLDDDGDAIADAAEISAGLNPLNPADALLDPDGDGFNNRLEIAFGTSINDASESPDLGGSVLRTVVGALPR